MAPRKKPDAKAPDSDDSGIVDLGPNVPPMPAGATEDEHAPPAKPSLLKNRKVLIGGAAALLLLVGGGGTAFMMSGGNEKPVHGGQAKEAASEEEAAPEEESEAEGEGEGKDGELPLVDVPPMIVNLRTTDGQPRYLKIHFMLEAKTTAKADRLKEKLPLIIDAYQPFLREMRPEDISGSAAVFRIKEEMLIRATQAAGKGMVKDVLLQDLVQQ